MLALCPYIAPSGYWQRKVGGWCVYEGCQVKHPEGYDNERCPMHRRMKNATNTKSMRIRRAMRRVQLEQWCRACGKLDEQRWIGIEEELQLLRCVADRARGLLEGDNRAEDDLRDRLDALRLAYGPDRCECARR